MKRPQSKVEQEIENACDEVPVHSRFLPLARSDRSADPLDKTALIGRWDYTSYAVLYNGKSSGTVQFKPGTMLFTYRGDGTWEMQALDPAHTALGGTYQMRSTELIMEKSDGSLYQVSTLS